MATLPLSETYCSAKTYCGVSRKPCGSFWVVVVFFFPAPLVVVIPTYPEATIWAEAAPVAALRLLQPRAIWSCQLEGLVETLFRSNSQPGNALPISNQDSSATLPGNGSIENRMGAEGTQHYHRQSTNP